MRYLNKLFAFVIALFLFGTVMAAPMQYGLTKGNTADAPIVIQNQTNRIAYVDTYYVSGQHYNMAIYPAGDYRDTITVYDSYPFVYVDIYTHDSVIFPYQRVYPGQRLYIRYSNGNEKMSVSK